MKHTIVIGIGLCAALIGSQAWSQDRLVMKNGDIITGTISKLEKGEVFIEPTYAGEYAIDIAEIETIETEQAFEVELADRSKVDAQLQVDNLGQQVLVIDGATQTASLDDIWEASKPEAYYDRDSRVEFGLTTNKGNTDTNNTLAYGESMWKVGDHRHNVDLTFRRDETDGVSTKEQDLLNYRYGWMFSDPWLLGGSFTYERDPIRELDYRYVAGVNIGRDIFDDATKFMSFYVGVGYSDEEIAGFKESGAVGLWNFTYTQDFFKGDLQFHHTHSITQQAFGDNNTIVKTITGFRSEFIADIYADISLRYDYETEPADAASNEDSTLTISVGADF